MYYDGRHHRTGSFVTDLVTQHITGLVTPEEEPGLPKAPSPQVKAPTVQQAPAPTVQQAPFGTVGTHSTTAAGSSDNPVAAGTGAALLASSPGPNIVWDELNVGRRSLYNSCRLSKTGTVGNVLHQTIWRCLEESTENPPFTEIMELFEAPANEKFQLLKDWNDDFALGIKLPDYKVLLSMKERALANFVQNAYLGLCPGLRQDNINFLDHYLYEERTDDVTATRGRAAKRHRTPGPVAKTPKEKTEEALLMIEAARGNADTVKDNDYITIRFMVVLKMTRSLGLGPENLRLIRSLNVKELDKMFEDFQP